MRGSTFDRDPDQAQSRYYGLDHHEPGWRWRNPSTTAGSERLNLVRRARTFIDHIGASDQVTCTRRQKLPIGDREVDNIGRGRHREGIHQRPWRRFRGFTRVRPEGILGGRIAGFAVVLPPVLPCAVQLDSQVTLCTTVLCISNILIYK